MNLQKKSIKAWVRALRSGKYTQGREQIYDRHRETYCCIGVLARIQNRNMDDITTHSFCHEGKYNVGRDTMFHLVKMNDEDKNSFEEIADYIEKTYL